jgi:hypothetical protein
MKQSDYTYCKVFLQKEETKIILSFCDAHISTYKSIMKRQGILEQEKGDWQKKINIIQRIKDKIQDATY